MLTSNNNRTETMVGKANGTTELAAGTVVTPANLPNGDIAVVNLANEVLVAGAGGNYDIGIDFKQFRIAVGQGTSNPLLLSNIMHTDRTTLTYKKYVAPTQQVTYVGYNGTSGSLPVANDTSYHLKITKRDNDAANRSQPTSIFAQYKTDSSGTQAELAFGLLANAIKNLSKEANGTNGYIKAEVVNNDAATNTDWAALGTATGDPTFTKGSKVVTVATATTSLTAGDYFRVSASATEALTDAVYKIESVDSATQITLTTPYQGETGLINDTTVHNIGATAGSDWGIRLTGIEPDFDVAAWRDYYQVRFDAYFSEVNTLVTNSTAANEGSGAWQKVAMMEYCSGGMQGQNEMLGVPAQSRRASVSSGEEFSLITLSWTEEVKGLVSNVGGKGTVHLALELASGDLTDSDTEWAAAETLFNYFTGGTLSTQLDE